MPTTFHITNFKNKTLNMLTGQDTSATPFGFINFYNGAQPADPSTSPAGAAVFASVSQANNVSTKMGAAGGGVTQLNVSVGPTTPSGAAGVAAITFARIHTTGQQPIVDCAATLAGGGGGAILDSLTSVAAVGPTLTALGFKMPSSLGTVLLSASLANRLADLWGGAVATTINMGNVTGGSSSLLIYSGAAPATADAPATGTLLATYNMTSTNLWAAASGGSSALNGAGPSVTASGGAATAGGYFRFIKNQGSFVFTLQGSVGVAATDLVLNNNTFTSGVSSHQITDATLSI